MNRDNVCVGDAFERRRIKTPNFLLTGKIQLIVAKYILLNVGTDISNVLFTHSTLAKNQQTIHLHCWTRRLPR